MTRPLLFGVSIVTLLVGTALGAATISIQLHLGDPRIHNMGKLREGNQIGVFVDTPPGTHVVGIQRRTDSSPWVHSCDAHEVNGTTCEWKDNVDKVGSSAYRYLPGQPHNKAEWLGWTDSGDQKQVFTLVVLYEQGP
jgi:hypothetical protein